MFKKILQVFWLQYFDLFDIQSGHYLFSISPQTYNQSLICQIIVLSNPVMDSITNDRYHTRVWRSVDTYHSYCQTYGTHVLREVLSSGKTRNEITVQWNGLSRILGKFIQTTDR